MIQIKTDIYKLTVIIIFLKIQNYHFKKKNNTTFW